MTVISSPFTRADGIDAPLSVVEPIVHLLQGWTVEDAYGILEGDAVKLEIAARFLLSVQVSASGVFTQRKYRSGGGGNIRR